MLIMWLILHLWAKTLHQGTSDFVLFSAFLSVFSHAVILILIICTNKKSIRMYHSNNNINNHKATWVWSNSRLCYRSLIDLQVCVIEQRTCATYTSSVCVTAVKRSNLSAHHIQPCAHDRNHRTSNKNTICETCQRSHGLDKRYLLPPLLLPLLHLHSIAKEKQETSVRQHDMKAYVHENSSLNLLICVRASVCQK